jgi:hypothetical protein
MIQDADPDAQAGEKEVAVKARRFAFVLAAATILAAPFAVLYLLVGVSWTDDEGTLMAGFRSLLDGHRMYDDIYSLYGPLFNLAYGVIYVVLRVPLTHDAGRLISATLWLVSTAGFAAFAWNLTWSAPAALLSYGLTLFWLTELAGSPGHPAELCLLLLVAALLLLSAIERGARSAGWGALGAAVAGLALVKINVGVYVGAPVVYALLRASPRNAWTTLAARLLMAAMLFMPLAVEAILFDFNWVRIYCLFSTLTVAAALIVSLPSADPADNQSTHWPTFLLAGGAASMIIVVGMMLFGGSAYAILNAVILQNLEWIRNWWRPLYLPSYGVTAAAASVGTALIWRVSESRPDLQGRRELGLLVLRCAYVAAAAAALCAPLLALPIITPFFWLIMLPPAAVRKPFPVARNGAALIAALMSLYAFPVAGPQTSVAMLLPVVFAAVIAYDALTDLRRRGIIVPGKATTVLRAMSAASLTIVIGLTAHAFRGYLMAVPLDLPGARLIRVDRQQADDLRWVTAQLSSCKASYSVPGMPSFAFWTGQPLVLSVNVNDVLGLISPARQEGVVRDLWRLTDLCIVYNPTILKRFDRGQTATDPPLLRSLRNDFVPKAERHGYVILMRRSEGSKQPY